MKHQANVIIKKGCHCRGMLSGIFLMPSRCSDLIKGSTLSGNSKEVGDPRQKHSGMTSNLMGFTLIELLVVVLIIGILVAVAVPQYNRAVEKTRLVQLRVRLDALYKSAQLYELANGQWPTDVRDLDLDVTSAAQEIAQSEMTASSHNAAKYNEDSWCGVHVSPIGNRTAWCHNKHVFFAIIKDKFSCTGLTVLGEKLCAREN